MATDYVEACKILSPEQEEFRAYRSCSRAITNPSLCVEDAHSNMKDIFLCYLDFKGEFSSTDHLQLIRVLEFSGLSHDLTKLVSKLYSEVSTECIIPRGHTPHINQSWNPPRGPTLSPAIRPHDRTPYSMAPRLTKRLQHSLLWLIARQQFVRGRWNSRHQLGGGHDGPS